MLCVWLSVFPRQAGLPNSYLPDCTHNTPWLVSVISHCLGLSCWLFLKEPPPSPRSVLSGRDTSPFSSFLAQKSFPHCSFLVSNNECTYHGAILFNIKFSSLIWFSIYFIGIDPFEGKGKSLRTEIGLLIPLLCPKAATTPQRSVDV